MRLFGILIAATFLFGCAPTSEDDSPSDSTRDDTSTIKAEIEYLSANVDAIINVGLVLQYSDEVIDHVDFSRVREIQTHPRHFIVTFQADYSDPSYEGRVLILYHHVQKIDSVLSNDSIGND